MLAHLHYKTLFSDIIMLDLMKNPVLSEASKITNPKSITKFLYFIVWIND